MNYLVLNDMRGRGYMNYYASLALYPVITVPGPLHYVELILYKKYVTC